jgi:hypothetical protein
MTEQAPPVLHHLVPVIVDRLPAVLEEVAHQLADQHPGYATFTATSWWSCCWPRIAAPPPSRPKRCEQTGRCRRRRLSFCSSTIPTNPDIDADSTTAS